MRPLRHMTPALIRQRLAAKCTNWIDCRVSRPVQGAIGRIRGNGVRAYWWTGERNFGDLLTPSLISTYGYTPVLCRDPGKADLAACGSIIGRLPADYSGVIFGSGLLSENRSIRRPKAQILALRGELTRDCLGVTHDILLGDLGILAVDLAPANRELVYTLGIVPHYEDYWHPVVRAIARRYPRDILLVNAQSSARDVVRCISQCEYVLSSSLHGLVVADALSIPNCYTVFSDKVIGKGFKFSDYYSAFGVVREPSSFEASSSLQEVLMAMSKPIGNMEERQHLFRQELLGVCRNLVGSGS